ncbi:MAG: DUF4062 domain-containing protein [Candidatus Marinimicrobia bacterium]|nr:DUF4062 domain-containing protein [Candidatus Neomarinimicrobiota bacterium]
MYFKPKIFLSSTFSLLEARSEIKEFFESLGAEVILYEKDLTPSINPATYRQDIKNSDFIIFIFDEKYGTKTNTGKSGTHEEWDIIRDTKIPKHVYLKNIEKLESEQQEFIREDVQSKNISYFYYDNVDELISQIKKMTFTLARDVAIYKLFDLKIEESTIKKLAHNFDYNLALQLIQEMDLLLNLQKMGEVDFIYTMILNERLSGRFEYFDNSNSSMFIDNEMNNQFAKVLKAWNNFDNEHGNLAEANSDRKVIIWAEKGFKCFSHVLKLKNPLENEDRLRDLLKSFLRNFKKFENYVFKKKINFDKQDCNYLPF